MHLFLSDELLLNVEEGNRRGNSMRDDLKRRLSRLELAVDPRNHLVEQLG
jgi:hypothetical protein